MYLIQKLHLNSLVHVFILGSTTASSCALPSVKHQTTFQCNNLTCDGNEK